MTASGFRVSLATCIAMVVTACATTSGSSSSDSPKSSQVEVVSQVPSGCRFLENVVGVHAGTWSAFGTGDAPKEAAVQDAVANARKLGATHLVVDAGYFTGTYAKAAKVEGAAYRCPG